MDGTLFRYWFVPTRWRRWSDSKRFWFTATLLLVIGSITMIPVVLLPFRIGEGIFGYSAELLGMVFFLIVNIASALAGATLITRERELQTMEALTLTPMGLPAIVRSKWLARTLFVMSTIALFVPFWLLLAGAVLSLNESASHAYYTANGQMPSGWVAARLGIYLGWLATRIVGHALPFVSLGVLVSACCRKTRTAIALTAGIVVLILPTVLYFLMLGFSVFDDQRNLITAIGLWPILPNTFDTYTATGLLSQRWQNDLTADFLWIVVLPAILLECTLYLCRRPERRPFLKKAKPISHGV